jgi:hypothetical protein
LPELYWQTFQQDKSLPRSFSLDRVSKGLPEWVEQAMTARADSEKRKVWPLPPQRVLMFSSLRYWTEHAALVGVTLAGCGQDVLLTYLPYANWWRRLDRLDQRRSETHARMVFQQASPALRTAPLMDISTDHQNLPARLSEQIQEVCLRDVQYTLQVEEVDLESDLYRLRWERNTQAALAALAWMEAERPDVIITPNGSILEMGAVYLAARHLGIPVVTYEFGEQRGRIWLARDAEVMRQETDDLWTARQNQPLSDQEWEQIRALFASRQRASLWENFSRLWQGLPTQGGERTRQALGLDGRPIVLMPANVIGDSLTLGRQIFSHSMTDWLQGSVRYFLNRPDLQLVVRVHPGERYTRGPSVADVIRESIPNLGKDPATSHIHLITANDAVNTYDLVEIADLGLVYTTTVGLEMAMSGVPVIVSGETHYRRKGFTLDPISWESYFEHINQAMAVPKAYRLPRSQVEQAWNYAYRFFFEYPLPFPWHLTKFWKDLKAWPVERVLSPEGQELFGAAFRHLTGAPRNWSGTTNASQGKPYGG